MQNLVSGRIARLVLIQLQFVKKELLVAMQAIDELFNANQVNLQLLAVTPAILAIFATQIFGRTVISAIKSSSRGKALDTTAAVHRDLRSSMRELERALTLSPAYHSSSEYIATNFTVDFSNETFGIEERGHLLSILFRVQWLLAVSSSNFESVHLKRLQEDLRDIATWSLSIQQRLCIIDRIYKAYPIMQPPRKVWGGGFLQ